MRTTDQDLPIKEPEPQSGSYLSTSTPRLTKFDLEEVLGRIDHIRQTGFGPEPTFIEGLISSGARDRRQAIEEARISAIKARKDLIDSLSSAIAVYVDTHKADLKVRGAAFVLATFEQLTRDLNSINESVITNYLQVYAQAVDDIEKIPHLTDDMRKQALENAYRRSQTRAARTEQSFYEVLDNLAEQVKKLSNEIGQR